MTTFQALDDKSHCVGVYINGTMRSDVPDDATHTWDYAEFLENRDIEYASLYCGGRTLTEVCPAHLQDEWDAIAHKVRAYARSFVEAKVDLAANCLFDLIPPKHLERFCAAKIKIADHVFKTYQRPTNYTYQLELTKLVHDIKHHPLNLDYRALRPLMHKTKVREWVKAERPRHINYNIFSTKTLRLTCAGFPILTMPKEYRSIIKPHNDMFVELDFNAAELRTMRALAGKSPIQEDQHEYNRRVLFRNRIDRKEAKARIFAWLYNPDRANDVFERFYARDALLDKYWDGTTVYTPFDHDIESDRWHALNYLLQSTTAQLVLRQAIKVRDLLKGYKTRIAFTIHDNIVLDACEKELDLIEQAAILFGETDLGWYMVNTAVGEHYGDMT